MGLRLRDSGVSSDNGSNYIQKFDVGEGNTTIMAVSTSGKNFMIDNSGKIDEKGRIDDVDETSSGYSSRESHCGENQDRVHRAKVQKSPKMVLVLNDKGRTIHEKDSVDKVERITENLSRASNPVPGFQLNDTTNLDFKQLNEKLQQFSSVASQTDDDVTEHFPLPNKICSCLGNSNAFPADPTVFRQPRIDLENDTVEEIPSDKTNQKTGNKLLLDGISKNTKTKTRREIETQTDKVDYTLLEECKNLRMYNLELEEKLSKFNDAFDVVVKELEKELLNAVTEISHLKKQVRAVGKLKLQSGPCARCGYSSDGDIVEVQSVSNSFKKSLGYSDMRKASSMDNLQKCSKQPTSRISAKTDLLKSLLKGQTPDKIKLSLLEKNKSLKDEINNLKTTEQVSHRRLSPPPVNQVRTQAEQDDSKCNGYKIAIDQRTSTEPDQSITTKEKSMQEDVRWRPQVKIIRRPKNAPAVHPQYTSAAFRTIHVTRWGQKS